MNPTPNALTRQTARSLATLATPCGVVGVSLSPIGRAAIPGPSWSGTGYAAFSCPQQTSLAIGITSAVRVLLKSLHMPSCGNTSAFEKSSVLTRESLTNKKFIGVDLSFRGNQ